MRLAIAVAGEIMIRGTCAMVALDGEINETEASASVSTYGIVSMVAVGVPKRVCKACRLVARTGSWKT